MRQILLLGIIALLFTACGETPKKVDNTNFSIAGQLDNINGKMIYLERVGMGKPVRIDSAIVAENGSFTLGGSTDIPNIFVLRIDQGPYNYLLIDKDEKVEVTGDGLTIGNKLNVAGSPGSSQLSELNIRLGVLRAQLDSLTKLRDSMMGNPEQMDKLTEISDEGTKLVTDHKEYLFSFIKENPSSLACIAALYQQIGRQKLIIPESNMEYFKLVDSSLMANYPTSIHVKNFHSAISKFENEKRQSATAQNLLEEGSEAPDISYPSPTGQMFTLSDLRGKYVLLDFWASWCAPCRRENPNLVANYGKFKDKGFEIFQVSLDKNQRAWEDAIISDKLEWQYHVSDLKYWDSAPAKLYNVSSIPSNFLINPEGIIIAKNLRGPQLTAKLFEIFK